MGGGFRGSFAANFVQRRPVAEKGYSEPLFVQFSSERGHG